MIRYIDALKSFRSKYKFVPKSGIISEYIRISERAAKEGNYTLSVYAVCHAMRLGYDINN